MKGHTQQYKCKDCERRFVGSHRRRNIRPPATTDQALRAAQPKGRPRA